MGYTVHEYHSKITLRKITLREYYEFVLSKYLFADVFVVRVKQAVEDRQEGREETEEAGG